MGGAACGRGIDALDRGLAVLARGRHDVAVRARRTSHALLCVHEAGAARRARGGDVCGVVFVWAAISVCARVCDSGGARVRDSALDLIWSDSIWCGLSCRYLLDRVYNNASLGGLVYTQEAPGGGLKKVQCG